MQEIAATILGRIIQLLLKDLQFIPIACSMCQMCLALLCIQSYLSSFLKANSASLHSANEILVCCLIKQGSIKNRGKSFAGMLTMKCNIANENILKPALPSVLWSHCIAVFKVHGCSNSSVGYGFENMLRRQKKSKHCDFIFCIPSVM